MRSLSAKLFLALVVFALSLSAVDLILRLYLQVPSDFLSRIVAVDPLMSPSKRLKPDLDKVLVGAYREFKFRLTTDEHGFRRSVPAAPPEESTIIFF